MKTLMTATSRIMGLAFAATMAFSCATPQSEKTGDSEVVKGTASLTDTVQQISAGKPVVSSVANNRWVELRNSNDPVAKMMATLATDDWQSAVALAHNHLEKNPGNQDGLTVLVAALALGKKYDLSTYYARKLEKLFPNSSLAFNVQGLTLMLGAHNRIADYRRAKSFFQKAIETNPGEIAAALNLGHLALEMGNAEEASQAFDKAASRCGNCTHALVGQGIAYARLGNWDRAAGSFERVLKAFPDHSRALFHLALVHKNGYNDRNKAESYLRKLLQTAGDSEGVLRRKATFVLRIILADKKEQKADSKENSIDKDETPPSPEEF